MQGTTKDKLSAVGKVTAVCEASTKQGCSKDEATKGETTVATKGNAGEAGIAREANAAGEVHTADEGMAANEVTAADIGMVAENQLHTLIE